MNKLSSHLENSSIVLVKTTTYALCGDLEYLFCARPSHLPSMPKSGCDPLSEQHKTFLLKCQLSGELFIIPLRCAAASNHCETSQSEAALL